MSDQIKNDGGPAFPIQNSGELYGMSLRDAFALTALQGLISISSPTGHADDLIARPKHLSSWAYQYADAMLAERSK